MTTQRRNVIIPTLLPKAPGRYESRLDREYSFSNSVLVGNWFEDRFAHVEDRKAITPGIYGNSNCINDVSVYHTDFKQPITRYPGEEHEEFSKWKQSGYRNYLNSMTTNIDFWNGDQFRNNFTTLKDIMYRILPEQDVNCHVLMPKKETVNDDYMRSFGNSTRTGLLQWRKCEKYIDNNTPVDMSHYKNSFKPFKIDKPITRCKGPQRKTSLTGGD